MPDWLNTALYWISVISSIIGIIGFITSIKSIKFSKKSINKSDSNETEINKLKNLLYSKFELNKSGDSISDELEKISQGIYSNVDTVQRFNSEIMMINSLGIELTDTDRKILIDATKCVKNCMSNNSYLHNNIQQIKSYARTLKFIIEKERYR